MFRRRWRGSHGLSPTLPVARSDGEAAATPAPAYFVLVLVLLLVLGRPEDHTLSV